MFTVRVEKTAVQQIGYYDQRVVISTTGDYIIEDGTGTLCKFSLQQDGSYSEQWRRQLPANISSAGRGCHKYLTETGDIILQDREENSPTFLIDQENSTTFLFDQDMKLKDSWQHQGWLIGCLPGPRAVYAVGEAWEYLVEIRSQNGEVMQLKPERKSWNSHLISVCEDGRTGKLVVVKYEFEDRSMDIFSGVGKTKHRIHHQIIMQVKICRESS